MHGCVEIPFVRVRLTWVELFFCAIALTGCVEFQPHPIEPEHSEADFRARRLSDRNLRAYVEARSSVPVSQWPPAVLDLDTAILVATYFSADLDVVRSRVGVAEAAVITAGARPNPVVGVAPGYTSMPGPPWLLDLTFDLPIETAGKRRYRIAQAMHLTEAARLELGEATWRVRSAVRAALLEHMIATRELELLRAQAAESARNVELLEQRLQVGEVSRPDVDTGRAELLNTLLTLHAAESRVAETRAALAASLGVPIIAFDEVAFGWTELDRPPLAESIAPAAVQRAGLLNRLDVHRALAEYAVAESALRLEVAKQYPDVHLAPGYAFDDGANKFRLGLFVTLPLFDQNQGPIAEAEARRRQAEASFYARQSQAIAETEVAVTRYRAVQRELAAADQLVANADARLAAMRRAVAIGAEDRLALSGLLLQQLASSRSRLDILRKTQAALGALEDAVQRPLESDAVPSPGLDGGALGMAAAEPSR